MLNWRCTYALLEYACSLYLYVCSIVCMHQPQEPFLKHSVTWLLIAHIGTDDNEFIVVKSQRVEVVYSRVKHTCVNTPIKYNTQCYWSALLMHEHLLAMTYLHLGRSYLRYSLPCYLMSGYRYRGILNIPPIPRYPVCSPFFLRFIFLFFFSRNDVVWVDAKSIFGSGIVASEVMSIGGLIVAATTVCCLDVLYEVAPSQVLHSLGISRFLSCCFPCPSSAKLLFLRRKQMLLFLLHSQTFLNLLLEASLG